MNRHDLFGGALTFALPSSYKSMAEIAPVPDNQEVFIDCNSDGTAIIVEINEHTEIGDPASFHFQEIDHANDCSVEGQLKLIYKCEKGLFSVVGVSGCHRQNPKLGESEG